MVIREVSPADADAVSVLAREMGYSPTPAETAAGIGRVLASPDHQGFVAVDDGGAVVGWVHVFLAHRLGSAGFAEIGGLVVAAGARRRGVGARLVAAGERWAAAQGFAKLRVRCNVKRRETHAFYEATGFRRLKEQVVFGKELP